MTTPVAAAVIATLAEWLLEFRQPWWATLVVAAAIAVWMEQRKARIAA